MIRFTSNSMIELITKNAMHYCTAYSHYENIFRGIEVYLVVKLRLSKLAEQKKFAKTIPRERVENGKTSVENEAKSIAHKMTVNGFKVWYERRYKWKSLGYIVYVT